LYLVHFISLFIASLVCFIVGSHLEFFNILLPRIVASLNKKKYIVFWFIVGTWSVTNVKHLKNMLKTHWELDGNPTLPYPPQTLYIYIYIYMCVCVCVCVCVLSACYNSTLALHNLYYQVCSWPSLAMVNGRGIVC
jgi:hypothetical protein